SLNEGAQVVTDIPEIVEPEEVDEPEIVMSNVFAESDDAWDYEIELENRREDAPKILHKDEVYAGEKNYMQSTLTFYEGDRVLVVEEDETPLYNLSDVTGMLRFGHGSGDPNVVYIRNDKRRAEYEVLRHEGHYAHEVLGLDIEERSNT